MFAYVCQVGVADTWVELLGKYQLTNRGFILKPFVCAPEQECVRNVRLRQLLIERLRPLALLPGEYRPPGLRRLNKQGCPYVGVGELCMRQTIVRVGFNYRNRTVLELFQGRPADAERDFDQCRRFDGEPQVCGEDIVNRLKAGSAG